MGQEQPTADDPLAPLGQRELKRSVLPVVGRPHDPVPNLDAFVRSQLFSAEPPKHLRRCAILRQKPVNLVSHGVRGIISVEHQHPAAHSPEHEGGIEPGWAAADDDRVVELAVSIDRILVSVFHVATPYLQCKLTT